MNRAEIAEKALTNAIQSDSTGNYGLIVEGFIQKGIAPEEIAPRVNVFTFNTWRALGRTVRKGEKGVRVFTVIPCKKKDPETGGSVAVKKSKPTTVFHISQTEEL